MKLSDMKEKAAFSIETALVIGALKFPPLIAIIPLIIYDITWSRNYFAFLIGLIAILMNFSFPSGLLVLIISFLSIIMSIKSEMIGKYSKDLKKMRDDSSEKTSRLRSQNTELLNARDTEIYNAQLSERNRIAREIHDNVGHTLSRAILQMGALLAIHKEEPIHTELEGVRETLDSAMNSIRSSVHDLHDDSIDVKANISDMAKVLRDKFNVNMDLDIGNDTPRPVKYAIIGISKECISNIIKHSTNTDVDIKLNEHPSMYQLIIHDYSLDKTSDSGSANESAKNKNNETNSENFDDYGMGLENIRSRVESVNGTLNISNHNGFRVFVSIPRK
jgi:signal transduction histidine kinase